MKEITQGLVDRKQKETQRKQEAIQKQKEHEHQRLQERLNNANTGTFKKAVIQSFLETFSNNYGDTFDYQSLVNAIHFNIKTDKNGKLSLDYTFKEDSVDFKSDAKKECREFNENSYTNFISNEDTINGNNVSRYMFDNIEEYDAYQESDIDESDFDYMDGQFISISANNERYGKFNKINKLLGYTPVQHSKEVADKKVKRFLTKIKQEV